MLIINSKTKQYVKVNPYPEKVLAYLVELTEKNNGKAFQITYKEVGEHFGRSTSWAHRAIKPLIKIGLVEWEQHANSQHTAAKASKNYTIKDY